MRPMDALYRAIEIGLESEEDDPGVAAGDALMGFAVDRGFDTSETDLLGHAEHLASIADFVVWLLRTGGPWERPADKGEWISSAFLNGHRLKRVVLMDRWTEERAIAEEHSWRVMGECAIYEMPMDLIVIQLGASRDGRRHGPISKCYRHPVSNEIRFRRRDGEPFGPTWDRVYRESSNVSREDWLEAMTEDGITAETITIHSVDVPPNSEEIRELVQAQMVRIRQTPAIPLPQLANCFDPISPCQFRSCCPYFRLPSPELGYIAALTDSADSLLTLRPPSMTVIGDG